MLHQRASARRVARAPASGRRLLAPAGLVVLTLLALGLRTAGLGHQLPHRPDDDSLVLGQAQALRALLDDSARPMDVMTHYPLLLAAVLAAAPAAEQGAPASAGGSPADELPRHLAVAAAPHRRARGIVALWSALAVPLAWLLARRFLGPGWALLAAALLATSLLHASLSQQARPHGPLATCILLALLAAVRLAERGGWGAHALAGATAGLAAACLHLGAFALPALGAAQLVRWRRDRWRAVAPAVLAWTLVAACVWLGYFAPVPRHDDPGVGLSAGRVSLSGHGFPLDAFDAGGFVRMPALLFASDPVLTLLGHLGLALAAWELVRRRRRPGSAALVLIAFAVPAAIVLGLYGRLPARFLLPLLPVLAIGAALAVRALTARGGPALAVLASLAVLALPTWGCAWLARLRSVPDTATLAARWIEQHVDRERDLLLLGPSVSLPLFVRAADGGPLATAAYFYWDAYQEQRLDPATRERAWSVRQLPRPFEQRPEATSRALDQTSEVLLGATRHPRERRLAVVGFAHDARDFDPTPQAVLAAGGRPVAVFPAVRGGGDEPAAGRMRTRTLESADLRSTLASARLGQALVVYELPPALELAGPR